MKIKSIKFENFRQFRESNQIFCSTDGKVTIFYGDNGVGKTTFQQLIKWIFYGEVTFNLSATDKLYNLNAYNEAAINSIVTVSGTIDFIDDGINYSLSRDWKYQKKLTGPLLINRTVTLLKKNSNGDYEPVQNKDIVINKILPKGLSSYFFFDGEGMVKDLLLKGRDSAKKLKESIYQILDLNVYNKALDYIGVREQKSSAIGTVYSQKTNLFSGADLIELGDKLDVQNEKRNELVFNLNQLLAKIKSHKERIIELSELIGSAKSQEEFEKERNKIKADTEQFGQFVTNQYSLFGEELFQSFPKVLLSSAMAKASRKLKTQAEKVHFVNGINKDLIDSLLNHETHCICGKLIDDEARIKLNDLYNLLPPKGYDAHYQNFKQIAEQWGIDYNKVKIENIIKDTTAFLDKISSLDSELTEIEKLMIEDKQYDSLVKERSAKEKELTEFEKEKSGFDSAINTCDLAIKQLQKQIDKLSQGKEANELIERKIYILDEIKNEIKSILANKTVNYSRKLEDTIQSFVNSLMSANRKVYIDENFAFKVVDNNGDESKSEGQFALVTFSFIGGLFKLLNEIDLGSSTKEYPLVLDAPFSKLTVENQIKVASFIPKYAPQIILFSKDNLNKILPSEYIGNVYTISSNKDFNDSKVNKGGF